MILSFASFVFEGVLFIVTLIYILIAVEPKREKIASVLVAIVTAIGALALLFPVSVLIDTPTSANNLHPLFLSLLICAPLMPIVLLLTKYMRNASNPSLKPDARQETPRAG